MNIINRVFAISLIIILSIFISCIFGAFHNQISYTVSEEFFQNFLFVQFEVDDWNIKSDRLKASLIGILGSYWMGFLLGIIYAIIYLFLKTENKLKYIFIAILINVLSALVGSLIAYCFAHFFMSVENSGIWMDFGTQNADRYMEASYMNTGSYFGGVVGLVIGVLFLLNKNVLSKT